MKLVLFHGCSDLSMLVLNGHELPRLEIFDPEVLAKWIWPDQEQGDLEHLTLRSTNMGIWRPNLRKLELEDFETMSDANLSRRCGNDAEAALRLARLLEPEIDKQGLRKIWNLAMDVLPILARIGGTGMALNRDKLKERCIDQGGEDGESGWIGKELLRLESDLGVSNFRSDQQVAKAL